MLYLTDEQAASLEAASERYGIARAILARSAMQRGFKAELAARRRQARRKAAPEGFDTPPDSE